MFFHFYILSRLQTSLNSLKLYTIAKVWKDVPLPPSTSYLDMNWKYWGLGWKFCFLLPYFSLDLCSPWNIRVLQVWALQGLGKGKELTPTSFISIYFINIWWGYQCLTGTLCKITRDMSWWVRRNGEVAFFSISIICYCYDLLMWYIWGIKCTPPTQFRLAT